MLSFEQSVSAFAPICNPIQCQWGKKALGGYLGSDVSKWEVRVAACRPLITRERAICSCIATGAGNNLQGASELVVLVF